MLLRSPGDGLRFDLGFGSCSISGWARIGSAGVIVVACEAGYALARLLPDLLAALFVAALIEVDVWRRSGVLGTHIAGPRWLTAPLPLLIALPLLWRRRFPLLVWTLILVGVAAQAVASGDSAEGLELLVALVLGSYAVAAFSSRPRALVGLGVFGVAYAIYALEDHNIRSGGQQAWSGAFFGLLALALWLSGSSCTAGARQQR